jgi:hypothetical protein
MMASRYVVPLVATLLACGASNVAPEQKGTEPPDEGPPSPPRKTNPAKRPPGPPSSDPPSTPAVDGGADAAEVPAERGDFTPGTRIRQKRATFTSRGEDGATSTRVADLYFDAERNETCQPLKARDGKTRCLPSYTTSGVHAYADPECTKPVLVAYGKACAPLQWLDSPYALVANGCTEYEVVEIGPARGSVAYNKDGDRCAPIAESAWMTVHEIKTIHPPSAFVEMKITE